MRAVPVQTGLQYAPVQSALSQDFWIAPSLPRHRFPVVHTISVPDKIVAVNMGLKNLSYIRSIGTNHRILTFRPSITSRSSQKSRIASGNTRAPAQRSAPREHLHHRFQHRYAFLENDGTPVKAFVNEMHGTACHLYPVLHSLPLGMETGKGGQESRMDIDHLSRKRLHNR